MQDVAIGPATVATLQGEEFETDSLAAQVAARPVLDAIEAVHRACAGPFALTDRSGV